MTQQQIAAQTGALGADGNLNVYVVPGSVIATPVSAAVIFDGSGAAGSFIPCLTFKTQTGAVIARCPASEVAAGDTAEVSWFPSVGSSSGGSGPYVPPTDREQLYSHTATTLANGDFDNLYWDRKLLGNSLLDISSPQSPTVVADGVYAVTVFCRPTTPMSVGGNYDLLVTLDSTGEAPFVQQDSAASQAMSFEPAATCSITYFIPAGGVITAGVRNNDGAHANNFVLSAGIVQKVS